jgi:hypothetical protein
MAKLTRTSEIQPEFTVTKRQLKHAEQIELIRRKREEGTQDVGYSSRPFVLCGLPVKKPPKGELLHTRRNGQFFLQVTGHPKFGLPFGQDRLIPIWLATTAVKQKSRTVRFKYAEEILDTFGLSTGGSYYKRLLRSFERVFTSTIYFGTEEQLEHGHVWDWTRFHFLDRMRLWRPTSFDQPSLPDDDFQNVIVLSEAFWDEITKHPIPVDLAVVRELTDRPGLCDFYCWLAWRCWKAEREAHIPLHGPGGLIGQLGVSETIPKRNFRGRIEAWLKETRARWKECPAELSEDRNYLVVRPGPAAIRPQGPVQD